MAAKTDDPTFDAANGVKITKQNGSFEPLTITPLPSETIPTEVGTEDDDVLNDTKSDDQ